MRQIWTITGSDYNCTKSSPDLNYPSFIVFYCDTTTLVIKQFRRIVTNVGQATSIYKVMVREPKDSKVKVSPMELVFRNKYEKQAYTLTMTYKGFDDGQVSFGKIVWVEENGKHTVRCPIVVSPRVHAIGTSLCYV